MIAIAESLVIIEPGQPGGQAFDGSLELGDLVDELAQLVSQPRQGDLVVAPACLELLDASVGEVHPQSPVGGEGRQANAASIRARCCASWTLPDPTEGAEDAGRVTWASDQRPGRCSSRACGRLRAMNGQAPWFAGSACTQRTPVTFS